MSNTKEIAAALQGASATNGWDAVLALNNQQVNALFFQQYLRAGPTNPLPGQRLRVMLNVGEGETFWILDVVLGPPEWSFQPGSPSATLEMALIKGSVIAFDPTTRTIHNAVRIRPNESKLTGALELAKVTGEVNQLGAVVADLGASAYSPTIVGVDPASPWNAAIGNAVTAFFAHNETKFHIGSIAPGKVPSLMPTDFHFTTQQKSNADDACVLLLIQTSGPAGTNGPLAAYPIPDGHTAGLLISDRALFNGALADPLNASFKNFGVHFSGNNTNGNWTTTGSGGAITVGQVNGQNKLWPNSQAWSSDSKCNEAKVRISLNGFSLSASNGKIVATWNCKQPQYWSVYNCNVPIGNMPQVCGNNAFQTSIQVNYTQTFDVIMKSGSDSTVAFNNHAPDLKAIPADFPSGWDRLWLGDHVPAAIFTSIQNALAKVFKDFTIPDVNTFALTSLLFPSQHAVHLKEVALPAGLYLTGSLDQPIAVNPDRTTLRPGQSIQFTVAGRQASDILWKPPRIGSISATGYYTAPSSMSSAEVVVITAVSASNPDSVGSAMVLVYQSPAATGVAVTPGGSLVTPGQHVQLSATDATGNPVSVDWTLSPAIGQIDPGLGQGLYIYTAPANVSRATEVTASAVNPDNHGQTGKAIIGVVPSTHISVKPEQSSLKYGTTVDLIAAITTGDADDLRWVVYPVGAGKVEPNADDQTKATYTAPCAPPKGNQVFVVAYLVNDQAAGLGIAIIKLSS